MQAAHPSPTIIQAEYYRHALHSLIDDGVDLTRILVDQARADPLPHPFWGDKAPVQHPTEHIAICYERVTRAVRRSIALAQTLDQPSKPRQDPRPAQADAQADAQAQAQADTQAQAQAQDDDTTEDEAGETQLPSTTLREPEQPETFPERPGRERSDTPDLDDGLAADLTRPIDQVIADIAATLAEAASSAPSPTHSPQGAQPPTSPRPQATVIPLKPASSSPPRSRGSG